MRPRGRIVGVENVPREIGHSRVSLDLPFNLEIHQVKYVKFEIFNFFHVFGYTFANISRSMRPIGKIVRVENVAREISYKACHSRVSLDLPFNLEIYKFRNVKFKI